MIKISIEKAVALQYTKDKNDIKCKMDLSLKIFFTNVNIR